ncbi:MAG: CHAT domain-containing protein [Isosphaerales bacterium]
MMEDPYIVGPPVTGRNHHGRVDLLQQVLSGARDCWCIVGLRRFGKTSFLFQLAHLVKSEERSYMPLYWSLLGCEDRDALLLMFSSALGAIDPPLHDLGIDLNQLYDHGVKQGLVSLLWRFAEICKRRGRKLLLLCDESEALVKLGLNDRGLLGQLRTVFQSTELVRTVLTGSRKVAELLTVDVSGPSFLSGFEPFAFLPSLNPVETEGLVRLGLRSTPRQVSGIHESTGGHPYFVQTLCSQIFRAGGKLDLETAIDKVHLERGMWIEQALEQDFSYLAGGEQAILTSLRDEGPACASDLCRRLRLPNENAVALLFALLQSRYIKSGTDGRYTFANAFLQRWLSRRTQAPPAEIPSRVSEKAVLIMAAQPQMTPASRTTVYEDFVIQISFRPGHEGGYLIRVLESAAGQASERLKLKPSSGGIQNGLRRIEAGYQGTKLFETFGTALFKAVFHTAIGDLYRNSVGRAEAVGHGLRLRLRIEPPELLVLPWELLFDPTQRRFLARSSDTPLSHYLELPSPHPPLDVKPPLRLLVVVSSPGDLKELCLPELDIAREKDQIARALHDWIEANLVAVEMMDNAIVHEVHDRMRRFQPHVVHFIGHGGLINTNGRDQGCLVLEDEQRQSKLVDEEKFCELVDHKISRLVVLNACKTAASSKVRGLAGIAPRLVRAGIPAVVAMRYPILDDAAITFSREFYRALASGLAVDAAVADARKGLFLDEESRKKADRSWFMPVLFMRAPDGRLFNIPEV